MLVRLYYIMLNILNKNYVLGGGLCFSEELSFINWPFKNWFAFFVLLTLFVCNFLEVFSFDLLLAATEKKTIWEPSIDFSGLDSHISSQRLSHNRHRKCLQRCARQSSCVYLHLLRKWHSLCHFKFQLTEYMSSKKRVLFQNYSEY